MLLFCVCACTPNGSDSEIQLDTSDTETETVQPKSLEIFSWWTAPGEAEALATLLDEFIYKYPNASIVNVVAEPGGELDAQQLLLDRIRSGDPPDVFQLSPRTIHN